MEILVDSGYVQSLAVCDLDKNTLEKLYEWARVSFYTCNFSYNVHYTSSSDTNLYPAVFTLYLAWSLL